MYAYSIGLFSEGSLGLLGGRKTGCSTAPLGGRKKAGLYMPDVMKHTGIHECIFCFHYAYMFMAATPIPSLHLSVWLVLVSLHYIPCRVPPPRPAPGQDGVRFRVGSLCESVGYPA